MYVTDWVLQTLILLVSMTMGPLRKSTPSTLKVKIMKLEWLTYFCTYRWISLRSKVAMLVKNWKENPYIWWSDKQRSFEAVHQYGRFDVMRKLSMRYFLSTDCVTVVGSDSATTCQIVVLQHIGKLKNLVSCSEHWSSICKCLRFSLTEGDANLDKLEFTFLSTFIVSQNESHEC